MNEAISKLKLTRIIVAHRPETITCADRVISLCDGKVVSDVLAKPSIHAEEKSPSSPEDQNIGR